MHHTKCKSQNIKFRRKISMQNFITLIFGNTFDDGNQKQQQKKKYKLTSSKFKTLCSKDTTKK